MSVDRPDDLYGEIKVNLGIRPGSVVVPDQENGQLESHLTILP